MKWIPRGIAGSHAIVREPPRGKVQGERIVFQAWWIGIELDLHRRSVEQGRTSRGLVQKRLKKEADHVSIRPMKPNAFAALCLLLSPAGCAHLELSSPLEHQVTQRDRSNRGTLTVSG